MVGSLILQHCLESAVVDQVTSISRKASGIEHPKLKEVLHENFLHFDGMEHFFLNQDVAYYCLGVYTGAVSRERFKEINVDFTESFGKMLSLHSPKASFCFLSGAGADQSGKSKMAFAVDKGQAEKILQNLDFPDLFLFRPAYIYPSTPRQEPNLSYKIMYIMYPLFKILYPSGQITSKVLAEAMFKAGMYGAREGVLENQEIKKIV